MPGLLGVLQAEHNPRILLTKLPTARNLRLVLDSQRVLSHEASLRVRNFAPELADKWRAISGTYTALVRESRDLGGHLSPGGLAASAGAHARARLQRLPRAAVDSTCSIVKDSACDGGFRNRAVSRTGFSPSASYRTASPKARLRTVRAYLAVPYLLVAARVLMS